ncbi:class IV adenylate cyclase [Candidatus Pacearchaeota archaeon]|nr:class IV adenylate cyclase [Candidatus Pacearchaeota archaeon]
MAIETEAKIKINEKEFKNLIKILGKPVFFFQENIIYRLNNGMVRVREENGERIITFKGKRRKSKFKSRSEIEFKTDSGADTLRCFFESFGLSKPFIYSKRRANFNFGKCVVSLDILKGKDYFIEVEGKKENIEKCLKMLGLEKNKIEKRSYPEILQNINS